MNLKEIIAKFNSELEFVKQVAVEVVKLGTENPDFQYNTSERLASCHYNGPATLKTSLSVTPIQAGPDCKGCIFGQALQNMGWDDENEMNCGHNISEILCTEYADILTPRTHKWIVSFRDTQVDQDNGASWGKAIERISKLLQETSKNP
jgi:hypothetical protein